VETFKLLASDAGLVSKIAIGGKSGPRALVDLIAGATRNVQPRTKSLPTSLGTDIP